MGSFLEKLALEAEVAMVNFVRPSELRWASPVISGLAQIEQVPFPQYLDLTSKQLVSHKLRMLKRWGLDHKPLLVAKHWSPVMAELLKRTAEDFKPDVVMIEFAVMAQYLKLFPDIPTVLTDHECGEPLPGKIGPWGIGRRRDRKLWEKYVRETYPQASLIQALNTEDAADLARTLGRQVEVRPPVVPIPEHPANPAKALPHCLFMGDFTHHPNPEAAAHLAHEVWPKVLEKHPGAQLLIAGPRASNHTKSLGTLPGVQFLGYVEDLQALLGRVRLVLAPLFSGNGSRIKVITALAHGLPVISNQLGMRGIEAPQDIAQRAESSRELAETTLRLLEDPDLSGSLGHAARLWVQKNIDPYALVQQQIERFATISTPASDHAEPATQ